MLPELHQSILHAFGAEKDPSTPLGVAWIPPGAYDKSHFHDVDVIVVALSKRNETGKLEVKKTDVGFRFLMILVKRFLYQSMWNTELAYFNRSNNGNSYTFKLDSYSIMKLYIRHLN